MTAAKDRLLIEHSSPGATYPATLKRLIPLQIWSGIKVTCEARTGLGVFERFTTEALQLLGTCRVDELSEITGIDNSLTGWWLERAVQTGLARRIDDATYAANTARCVDALRTGEIATPTETELDVLWLPESDEFLALGNGNSTLEKLRKIRPMANYPLPSAKCSDSRGETLRAALNKGRLYGDQATAISAIAINDAPLGDDVPAYLVEVELTDDASDQLKLVFYSEQTQRGRDKQRRKEISLSRRNFTFPALPGLLKQTRSLADTVLKSAAPDLEQHGLQSPHQEGDLLVATMKHEWALAKKENGFLDGQPRLDITADNEVSLSISCKLTAQDAQVQAMLELDASVARLRANGLPAIRSGELPIAPDVSRAQLMERLWQLKDFRLVYALREAEDFA